MKRRRLPVKVERAENNAPAWLFWKGNRSQVECRMNAWVIQGRWWGDEVRREYVQLLTSLGAVEIYREANHWWLSRTLD